MPMPQLQRGSFNLEKGVSLSGLMECLVSAETQQNLFDRIADEDEDPADIGLTDDLANQGINWWAENQALLDLIIEQVIAGLNQPQFRSDHSIFLIIDSSESSCSSSSKSI